MSSGSISCSPVVPKDLAKKKRTNRLAKLKQSKLDVRREQWLSHVKNKGPKVNLDERGGSPTPSRQIDKVQNVSLENLEMSSTVGEIDSLSIHDSDLDSLMNSPTGSSLDCNVSVKNLSESSSSDCSGNVSREDDDDDGCLDDWEAVADALNAEDNNNSPTIDLPAKSEIGVEPTGLELASKNLGVESKPENINMDTKSHTSRCAWRPDDSARPQSLPNVPKQHGYLVQSDWHCGHGAITWAWQNIVPQPSSCPICYEDLDVTDSSFLPCSCGFRLCLFCHKRILEADGRCPGCRKQYDRANGVMGLNGGATTFRVA